ncbi:MAG: hypothetical protein NTV94_13380 [Planctomycetota bacterium]|nr:hypothetical protein [Planctomycetota bacterium]
MSTPSAQLFDANRETLQARQLQLLQALRGGTLPEGFDAAAVQRCGQSLIRKRTREAARALPAHSRWLERLWIPQFARFALERPAPSRGGPMADGLTFLRWLEAQSLIEQPPPRNVRVEAFFVRLRWKSTPDGAEPRTGPRIGLAFFTNRPRILLAARFTSRHHLFERHWWF